MIVPQQCFQLYCLKLSKNLSYFIESILDTSVCKLIINQENYC